MNLDDYAAVQSLRNNPNRNTAGIVTLIISVILLSIGILNTIFPADYEERIILTEDGWISYPVSIYSPLYEGDEIRIEFEVGEKEYANVFIVDDENLLRLVDEQTYEKLFEIDSPINKKEIIYTLIKDGPINVVFYNPNFESITIDIVITDLQNLPYTIFYLLAGSLLGSVGIISLTGKEEAGKKESSNSMTQSNSNEEKTTPNINNNEGLSQNERNKIISNLAKEGKISGGQDKWLNKKKAEIANKYADDLGPEGLSHLERDMSEHDRVRDEKNKKENTTLRKESDISKEEKNR